MAYNRRDIVEGKRLIDRQVETKDSIMHRHILFFALALFVTGIILATVRIVLTTSSGMTELAISYDVNRGSRVTISSVEVPASRLMGFIGLHFQTPNRSIEGNDFKRYTIWQDGMELAIQQIDPNCHEFTWVNYRNGLLKDCFSIGDSHWFGGDELVGQQWPIEKGNRSFEPFTKGNVKERFWVNSDGFSIRVSNEVPLFYSVNQDAKLICFGAKHQFPYAKFKGQPLYLNYTICRDQNLKDSFLKRRPWSPPLQQPGEKMMLYPIWTTWVEFKDSVNQSKVLDFAEKIKSYGFPISQLEIDESWEPCFGDATFDITKYPNASEMIDQLNNLGIRCTLWTTPFINRECNESFNFAASKGYFLKNEIGAPARMEWWKGDAAMVDPSNPDAVDWWRKQRTDIQKHIGFHSFKFDAGEAFYAKEWFSMTNVKESLLPDAYTTGYVSMVSAFGPDIEIRVGYRTQKYGRFVRIYDRESTWDNWSGLKSVIPAVFMVAILGYPFVLPDMVGGCRWDDQVITKELLIRWTQLSTFMPGIQLSVPPWHYDNETINIVRHYLQLRVHFAETLKKVANEASAKGIPMVRPLWWIAPEDENAMICDDEYLLGDDLLVAPVVDEGQTSRNIYLPKGVWRVECRAQFGTLYTGPVMITDFPAPLQELPYFQRL